MLISMQAISEMGNFSWEEEVICQMKLDKDEKEEEKEEEKEGKKEGKKKEEDDDEDNCLILFTVDLFVLFKFS